MSSIQIANYFIALLTICNPIGALPIFLKLTATDTYQERRTTSVKAAIAVFCILFISAWLGIPLLHVLGIRIAPFQFAGGLVILLLALSMLRAEGTQYKQTTEEKKESVQKESIAVTPLAIPLIAGPGAISSIITTTSIYAGMTSTLIISLIILGVSFLMGSVLFFSSKVENVLGQVGINIFTRIGGLVVASNAIGTLERALKEMFPVLMGS